MPSPRRGRAPRFRLREHDALPGPHEGEHLEICDFLCGDGFYVAPTGDAYLCTTRANDPRYRLGRVEEGPKPFDNDRFLRVLNLTPFEDPRCGTCSLLPACVTVCPLWDPGGNRYSTDSCVAHLQSRIATYVRDRDRQYAEVRP